MPEPLIRKEDARFMKFDIDLDGIRAGMKKLLAVPGAAEFVAELLRLASEISPKEGNKVAEGGDVLKVFDIIRHDQDGFFRGNGNLAHGSLAQGNARIELGNLLPGADMTETDLKKLCLDFDIPLALHETIHHTGELCYTDEDLARAVCKIQGVEFEKKLPPREGEKPQQWMQRCSSYWHKELKKRCRV